MKRQFINCFVILLALFTFSCKSDDGINYESKEVDKSILSTNSTTFLKTHFKNQTIKSVQEFVPVKPNGAVYEINLTDHYLVEVDKVGNWIVIEKIGNKPIENNLVNLSIQYYISKAYKGKTIEKVERTKDGFEVELENDIDLKFNKNGEFIERLP